MIGDNHDLEKHHQVFIQFHENIIIYSILSNRKSGKLFWSSSLTDSALNYN
jgi:hypothetical protein